MMSGLIIHMSSTGNAKTRFARHVRTRELQAWVERCPELRHTLSPFTASQGRDLQPGGFHGERSCLQDGYRREES